MYTRPIMPSTVILERIHDVSCVLGQSGAKVFVALKMSDRVLSVIAFHEKAGRSQESSLIVFVNTIFSPAE
jgi:hypothetical protein